MDNMDEEKRYDVMEVGLPFPFFFCGSVGLLARK